MKKRNSPRSEMALYNAIGRKLAAAAKKPVTPALPAKPERGNRAVTNMMGLTGQKIGRGLRIPGPVVVTDLATGCITLDIVKNDFERNGSLQMQVDLAEAAKNGVKLTPEAEEYVQDAITGYPMRDSDW